MEKVYHVLAPDHRTEIFHQHQPPTAFSTFLMTQFLLCSLTQDLRRREEIQMEGVCVGRPQV